MRTGWVLWVLVPSLILSLIPPEPAPQISTDPSPPVYAGWAMEAYPELSYSHMEAEVRRQVEAGANVVWIGHNNPGIVEADKVEPGLSYAVFEALQDPADPRHAVADAMVQAQHRMLDACRAVGVKAVLPVGYQIQMGRTWNEEHSADLRLDAEGQPLNIYGGGVSATFYAPSYRQDIQAYYQWIDTEFARPYADVILMLNLADEPVGGDYSTHANSEFRRQYGFGFEQVGDDPHRQRCLGEFQSRYVVEYASYCARLWLALNPSLPVTMSFDGGQARSSLTMPEVEALFRDPPSNLVVTFDAYPHDGLPNMAMSDKDLVELALLVQSLGLYSERYGRPLWLWAAANSWGLSQASPDPGAISDAIVNGLSLALWVRRTGGTLHGITYWNCNVKGQGLYNDTHVTAYEPEDMFVQVSAMLTQLRELLLEPVASPCVLVLSPPPIAQRQIGATREAVRLEVQPYDRLEVLAKLGTRASIVSELDGWSLDHVRTIIVLASSTEDLSPGDQQALGSFLKRGGRVVTSPDVGGALLDDMDAETFQVFGKLVERTGGLYVAQRDIAVLFEDARYEVLSAFWKEVLGIERIQPGYQILADSAALWYNPGPEPIKLVDFPGIGVHGFRYDDQGHRVQPVDGLSPEVSLGRREYLLLQLPSRQDDE